MFTDPDLAGALTVGVTTRNRPESLLRCVRSLSRLGELISQVVVVDDGSEVPAAEALAGLPPGLAGRTTCLRQAGGRGYIAARNTIVSIASTPYVLLLDDDTLVIEGAPLARALAVMHAHPTTAAIACAQAEADGSPWPAAMQPSQATYPCLVAAFIGFAHIVRRSAFLELGGYRESFHFYGEEKDFCMRLLEAGHQVVYLPDALVAHVPDPSGRDQSRYLRYVIRNDCLCAMYNEPLPMALVSVPLRLRRYAAMRRHGGVRDAGGLTWIVRELTAAIPRVWRDRTPLRWRAVREWRRLRRAAPPFPAGAADPREAAVSA
jgi:GT2 family glycosyltransferase